MARSKTYILRVINLLMILGVAGCERQPATRTYTDSEGVKHEVVEERRGFGEHLAEAAVVGAVGGAAAGAGHRAADHAINRWQERRQEKRSIRRGKR